MEECVFLAETGKQDGLSRTLRHVEAECCVESHTIASGLGKKYLVGRRLQIVAQQFKATLLHAGRIVQRSSR